MSCSVTRDNKGQIIKVLNPNTGLESKVFNEIAKLPHVDSLEQAVKIYDEVLKANPQDKLDGFVSNTISAITNLKDKAVKNIKGWMNQLTDVQKNGGIRNVKQELDWIGLEDYLNEWVQESQKNSLDISKEVDDEFITLTSEYGKISLSEVMTDFEFEDVLSEEQIEELGLDDMVFKLDSIEINETSRGKGYAVKMMNIAIDEFQNKNFNEIVLNASPMGFGGLDLNSLTAFYKKFGFKVVADQGGNRMMVATKDTIKKAPEKNQIKNKNGNIPISVIEDYVKSNQIEIVEVSKGKASVVTAPMEEEPHILEVFRPDDVEGDFYGTIGEVIIKDNGRYLANVPGIPQREFSSIDSAKAYINSETDYGTETKYGGYQLEGGENYREVLLTLPNKDTFNNNYNIKTDSEGNYILENKTGKVVRTTNIKNQQIAEESFRNEFGKKDDKYRSSHWDESNILAHIRLNERTLPSGERVLFIEEVQSDWAQEGKKEGFFDPKQEAFYFEYRKDNKAYQLTEKEIKEERNKLSNDKELESARELLKKEGYYIGVNFKGENKRRVYNTPPTSITPEINEKDLPEKVLEAVLTIDKKSEKYDKLSKIIENLQKKYGVAFDPYERGRFLKPVKRPSSLPNMPYKKTDQWVGMAMRKVYQMAAQEGFDRVAWVTGEQSADRYDLSKQVDAINYRKTNNKYEIDIVKGNTVIDSQTINESELESSFGKDVAEKMIKGESTREAGGLKELSGLDLKVGGEGMKTFYNSILPKVAKKEAQRLDKKSKVEVVDFNDSNNKSYFETVEIDGENFYKLMVDGEFIEGVEDSTLRQSNLSENEEGARKYLEEYVPQYTNAQGAGQQLSVPITDKIKEKLVGGTLLFSLEDKKSQYNSFKEALSDTDSNTIDIISNGKVVATFPSTLDERTTEGVINSLIADNIVKPNKVILNGKTYFQTTGETAQDRMVSEEFLKESLKTSLSKDSYTISNGLLDIHPQEIVESEKGSLHRVVSDRLLDYFSSDTVITKKNKIDENNLKLNLLKILSDMGVSVLTLKQYQDKFKRKSQNIPPSAEALADVVNRVIAFKEGKLNLDNLTEEVMHLIVETLPQEQVAELSDLIKNSQEYQDHYEKYKEVYNNDNVLIEKEILGKILKNITLNKVEGKDKSFISKLIDIIENFFKNLTLSATHKDQLKQLNSLVEKFVTEQNGEQFTEDDLANSRQIALMYSLSDQVSNAQGTFQKTFKNITDYKQFNSYKRELKNTTFDNLRGRELSSAVSRFIEMSTKLIETTESALNTAKRNNKALSGQNAAILKDLDNEIRSNLLALANELDSPQPGIKGIERTKLSEKLRENASKIADLRTSNDSTTDDHIKQMVEDVVQQMGQAESVFYREQVEKVLKGEIDDINRVFSFFGQLHHASNPILNMIGNKIWEMNMKANKGIKEDISPFLNYLDANPKLKDQLQDLVKNGYFEDVVDHKAFDDALTIQEMDAFSSVSEQEFTSTVKVKEDNYNIPELTKQLNLSKADLLDKLASLENYRKLRTSGELKTLSNEQYGNYRTALDKNQQPLLEKIMNEKYYKELFKKYDDLNISGATQSFLKENSSQRGAVKAGATQTFTDESGNKKSRVVLTPQDNDILNSISKIRKAKKNIYSEISLLKKGLNLSINKPEGESVLLATGQYLSLNLSDKMSQGEKDDANISFDLHKLDNAYAEKVKEEGTQPNNTTNRAKLNFLAYITSLQDGHSEQEIFDVAMSNLDISLSQDFYDTLNGDSFLKGDTLNKLNPTNLELVEDVKQLYAKRNSILSMYRNTSSPFEIDRMTTSDQDSIRSLSLRISDALKVLKLPEGTEAGESAGEKAPNKAYVSELDRRGIQEGTQEELDFLINSQHTNLSQLNRLKDAYYKSQAGIPLSDADLKLLSKYIKEDLVQTQLNYAKNNLQPYYTRFAPIGYKSIEERLQNGEELVEVLNSVFNDNYLNIRIDNSFEEKDNPLKNPNYNDSYDGGFRQPKKGSFVNQNFISKFGINERGEATKNKELFEARRLYLEARKKGLEKMNEKGANPYKVIQISSTTTEKLRKLAKTSGKKAVAKELLKDTFAYRIDDLAYGETGFQENRTLPKYYTRDLEDSTDVSTDYIFALTQFVSRANEYKAKRNVISDIDALYDVLLRSKRHSKSKVLKNTIEMADSFINGNIYGKIENLTHKVKIPGTDYSFDLAKVARVMIKYISLKNLGYNITVPATGYLSGVASKKVEEWIGEKLNKDSSRLATKEYNNLYKNGISNSLEINDNSKLFLIGQAFGIYDISDKTKNAKYNTFQRTFSKSAMSLHTVANYPIIPKIALTVMYDNRIIDNKIYNRTQYFQENSRNGVPKEQVEARWKAAEEDAIYNYMNFTKTGFSWNPKIEEKISDKEYLENRKLFMMKFIRAQVSNIDATIPKEMKLQAQRNILGSMVLLHKGFLSIFIQNRFKDKNLNIDSGLIEEGSYRTLGKLGADFFNTKGNFAEKIEALKKSLKPPAKDASSSEWLDYELRIRNMKRIGRELSAIGILAALGTLVFAIASDPDNEDIYAMQMTSYLTTRLLNESSSAFTPSLLGDVNDVIENPISVFQTGKEMANFYKLFDGDEITRGKYKGLSQRQKWITKNVLGVKGVYDVYGADNIRTSEDTYRLYNEEGLKRAILGLNNLYEK